jgi:hypothetical protein
MKPQVLFALLLCLLIATLSLLPAPALANIRSLEEKPGQMLYQSRQTLEDNQGNTWQIVFFKRIPPEGVPEINLRLVGFPGRDKFQHPAPLAIETSPNQTVAAADVFETKNPGENVGQFDLAPVLDQLETNAFWRLDLPLQDPVSITVPAYIQQEWQKVAQLTP